jgi:hypothetical protein
MSLRSILASLAGGALLASVLAGTAAAHAHQSFGLYDVAIGWLNEPTYDGLPNAVQVLVKDGSGKPVSDVTNFTVTLSAGGKDSAPLPLESSFDADTGTGTEGQYTAEVIPTLAGDYTFHLKGTIHDQAVDHAFTSGEQTFDSPANPGAIEFPVQVPAAGEIATRVDRVDDRAQSAGDAAGQALVVGGVLGGLGVILGLIGIGVGVANRRRSVG